MKPIKIDNQYYIKFNGNLYQVDKFFTSSTTECKEGYYYIVRINKHRMGAPRYLRETFNNYLFATLGHIYFNRSATTDIKKAARFYTKDFTKEDILYHASCYVKHLRARRYNPNDKTLTQLEDIELIKKRCHYHNSHIANNV